LDTLPTVTLPWHCGVTHRTIKIGVYGVVGGLFAIEHRDLSWVDHICWCHSGNLYGFGHVLCDTPATLVGVSSSFHSFLCLLTFVMVQWEALWSGWLFGEWQCLEICCCAAGCSNLQNCSAMMDLTICQSCCQIPHSVISSFGVAPCGCYSKVYSKDLYNQIF
jgi:hypothetical protein